MDEQSQYFAYLPLRLRTEAALLGEGKAVEEIRLRVGMPMSLTVSGNSIRGKSCMTEEEARQTVQALCGGSIHAYEDCMIKGYIPLPGGGRAGVAGRAIVESERIVSIRQISTIVIRIPGHVRGIASPILAYMEQTEFSRGLLIYAMPGVGKTTTLRELAIRLSKPPYLKRVALIDSRMELFRKNEFEGCLCDCMSGYPKPQGISLAVCTLSPQIMICDEIGTEAECRAISEAYPSGVPLIASVHGKYEEEILTRCGIRDLIAQGVFGALVSLHRRNGQVIPTVKRLDRGRNGT